MIRFRVLIKKEQESACNSVDILKQFGFSVYDILETSIVDFTTKVAIYDAFLICCFGDINLYGQLRKIYNFDEIVHEGVLTLM